MSEENELLFDELYEKTKECGRQFIKLLIQKERENQSLKKQLEEINYTCVPNSDIKNVIDKYKNQQKEFINKIKELETKLKENGINE